MPRLQHQPQIIEEIEDEESDNEPVTKQTEPLRPTTTTKTMSNRYQVSDVFPYHRRHSNSPFAMNLADKNLRELTIPEEPLQATSPTPSTMTTCSRHEFVNYRLSEDVMKEMMNIGTIHDGKMCKMYKFVNTATMANYAVIEWSLDKYDKEKISHELDEICQLRHKRLASIFGYHWRYNQLYIFRTHVPTGTIADILKKRAIAEEQAVRFSLQLADALSYLHEKHRVHGKVTTSNLLLTISNDILLSDIRADGIPWSQKRQTLLSSPPEAFKSVNDFPVLTPAADVWSIGCALVAMITRHPPYSAHFLAFHGDKLHKALVNEWNNGNLNFTSSKLVSTNNKDVCELIDAIFITDPSKRPTAASISDMFSASRKISEREPAKDVKIDIDRYYYCDDTKDVDDELRESDAIEKLIERHEMERHGFYAFFRWFISRAAIFSILLFKWIGMVLCASLSLALVAGSVFFSIFVIYNGIEVVCQCRLNEGFVVLIALILLPIIILLTTLCCNNSLEKYRNDCESGKVERSWFVKRTPEKDVVICGYIIIEGKPRHENTRKIGVAEGVAAMMSKSDFLSGVARIA